MMWGNPEFGAPSMDILVWLLGFGLDARSKHERMILNGSQPSTHLRAGRKVAATRAKATQSRWQNYYAPGNLFLILLRGV